MAALSFRRALALDPDHEVAENAQALEKLASRRRQDETRRLMSSCCHLDGAALSGRRYPGVFAADSVFCLGLWLVGPSSAVAVLSWAIDPARHSILSCYSGSRARSMRSADLRGPLFTISCEEIRRVSMRRRSQPYHHWFVHASGLLLAPCASVDADTCAGFPAHDASIADSAPALHTTRTFLERVRFFAAWVYLPVAAGSRSGRSLTALMATPFYVYGLIRCMCHG